jgi:hypothetical protein
MGILPGSWVKAFGQSTFAHQEKSWEIHSLNKNSLVLEDTFSIDAGSLRALGRSYPDTCWEVKNNQIFWICEDQEDSLELRYRTLSFNVETVFRSPFRPVANPDLGLSSGYSLQQMRQMGNYGGEASGLDYSGLFNRSLSLGNSQDLFLNSQFNLQLSGVLGDDVEILGVITDNNFPIQPQGNTQQIQEFDRVFIQLQKQKNILRVGDDEIKNPTWTYFNRYFKKIQGVTYAGDWDTPKGQLRTQFGGAVSKGKFHRLFLPTLEGNQGPYKLTGADGEPLIIVLAGTERVFWDGVLLSRGENKDYTMDYNQGEITFTSRRIITKDSRISIEYEYSAQYYTRSLLAGEINYQVNRWEIDFSMYSEQDGLTPTELQVLSEEDRFLLATSESRDGQVLASGVRPLDQQTEPLIVYNRIDTLVNGIVYREVLVLAREGGGERYAATFSRVGLGRGSYRLSSSVQNGRNYEWVAPDAMGRLQGEYEPIRVLIAPQQWQLINTRVKYGWKNGGFLAADVALSNQDRNRYALLSPSENTGLATNIAGEKEFRLGQDSVKWRLKLSGQSEIRASSFRTINPYRTIEFNRDWNFDDRDSGRQIYSTLLFSVVNPTDNFQSAVGLTQFVVGDQYNGSKYFMNQQYTDENWEISTRISYLVGESDSRSQFLRPTQLLTYKLNDWGGMQLGLYFEKEQNRLTQGRDSLRMGSFDYNTYRSFVELPAWKDLNTRISWERRLDYSPDEGVFALFSTADDYVVSGAYKNKKTGFLQWNFTYRELQINNFDLNTFGVSEGRKWLGRINYNAGFFRNTFRFNTIYEVNSGQEPKTELTFVSVENGRGTHIWTDYNGDGIQQLGEFDLAPFPDTANYIQFFNRTDALVGVNHIVYNQSINIIPLKKAEAGNLRSLFQRFSLLSQVVVNRRTTNLESVSPFLNFREDADLLSGNLTNNHILYFNRNDPSYELQLGYNGISNRSLLLAGLDTRTLAKLYLRFRRNIKESFTLVTELGSEEEFSSSELTDTRNFELNTLRASQELGYQWGTVWRSVLKYQFRYSANNQGFEQARIQELNWNNTWVQSNKSNVRVEVTGLFIQFTGNERSPLALAMLEGFREGRNILVSAVYERKLANNIRMSFGYEGRKSQELRFIHTARAQVGAVF